MTHRHRAYLRTRIGARLARVTGAFDAALARLLAVGDGAGESELVLWQDEDGWTLWPIVDLLDCAAAVTAAEAIVQNHSARGDRAARHGDRR